MKTWRTILCALVAVCVATSLAPVTPLDAAALATTGTHVAAVSALPAAAIHFLHDAYELHLTPGDQAPGGDDLRALDAAVAVHPEVELPARRFVVGRGGDAAERDDNCGIAHDS